MRLNGRIDHLRRAETRFRVGISTREERHIPRPSIEDNPWGKPAQRWARRGLETGRRIERAGKLLRLDGRLNEHAEDPLAASSNKLPSR